MKKKIILLISLIFLGHTLSRADAPQWSVDASKYEFSMTITSAIYINGSFIRGEDVMLAAMVGDEVRGTTSSVYDQYHDRWLFFLTVFSNQFTGENITFRFYDPIAEEVSSLWNKTGFASATNHGSVSNPFVLFTEEPTGKSSVVFQVEDENGQSVIDAIVSFNGVELAPGAYKLEDIAPGSYPWSVARQGYITSTGDVFVGGESPIITVNVVLQPFITDPGKDTYSVRFTVHGANGIPVSNTAVLFDGVSYVNHLIFNNIEPGTYAYQISSEGYLGVSGQVTVVTADVHVQVTLQLVPSEPEPLAFEIHFSVIGLAGNLLDDVEILLNGNPLPGNQVISNLSPGQYNYQVRKEGYISREGQINITTSNVYIDIILLEKPMNTADSNLITLSVYPNPATDHVAIHAEQRVPISAIEVYTTSGHRVMHALGFYPGDKIDISPLAKGVYLFTIVLQNGERIIEKLVVN